MMYLNEFSEEAIRSTEEGVKLSGKVLLEKYCFRWNLKGRKALNKQWGIAGANTGGLIVREEKEITP